MRAGSWSYLFSSVYIQVLAHNRHSINDCWVCTMCSGPFSSLSTSSDQVPQTIFISWDSLQWGRLILCSLAGSLARCRSSQPVQRRPSSFLSSFLFPSLNPSLPFLFFLLLLRNSPCSLIMGIKRPYGLSCPSKPTKLIWGVINIDQK